MEVKVTKRLYRQIKRGFSLNTLSSYPPTKLRAYYYSVPSG